MSAGQVDVRRPAAEERPAVARLLAERWSSTQTVSRDQVHDAALDDGVGIGTALVDAVAGAAVAAHARQLVLSTTNDNLRALGFCQRRGFRLVELLAGGVDRARERKPSIPLVGSSGIAIRDELVLVRDLERRDGDL